MEVEFKHLAISDNSKLVRLRIPLFYLDYREKSIHIQSRDFDLLVERLISRTNIKWVKSHSSSEGRLM